MHGGAWTIVTSLDALGENVAKENEKIYSYYTEKYSGGTEERLQGLHTKY